MAKSNRKEQLEKTPFRILQFIAGSLSLKSHGRNRHQLVQDIIAEEKAQKKAERSTAKTTQNKEVKVDDKK